MNSSNKYMGVSLAFALVALSALVKKFNDPMNRLVNFLTPHQSLTQILLLGMMISSFTIAAEPGDFVKDIKIEELNFQVPKVEKEVLGPGLVYYHDKFDEFPIAYLEIHFYAGDAAAGKLQPELSSLFCDSWKYGGTEKYPNEKLLTELESLGANLYISSDYEKVSLSVSFLSRDEDRVLELLTDLLAKPALPDAALKNGKIKISEAIRRRNERTESIGFRKAKELFYRSYPKGKSYSLASVESVSKEDLLKFYDLLQKAPRAVVSSGLYDEEKLKDFILTNVQKETVDKTEFDKIDLEKLNKDFTEDSRKQIFIAKEVNQSMLLMTGTVPEHNSKDFFAIQLLNYMIGGGGFNSYFMQEIREKRGLAYSAASYPVFQKDHGIIYFYTLTKNESILEAHNLMRDILSETLINKITDKQLSEAKNAISTQFVFLFSNRHSVLENQLGFDEDSMPQNYMQTYREKLQDVTIEDIRRVGKEYFVYDKLKTIIISSPKTINKFFPDAQKLYQPDDLIVPETTK